MSNSDCDSDEELALLRKALDVTIPENFNPNKTPQDGTEYIQYVMYEARKCRQLVVANIDKSKLKNTTYKIPVREDCRKIDKCKVPTMKWQHQKVHDFAHLSNFVLKQICSKNKYIELSDKDFKSLYRSPPKFDVIVNVNHETRLKFLQHIIEDLDQVAYGESITMKTGTWILSILVSFEIPLSPDLCYCLRELARKCSVIRFKLPSNASEVDYSQLNLFICIVARHFKQLDLADENDV